MWRLLPIIILVAFISTGFSAEDNQTEQIALEDQHLRASDIDESFSDDTDNRQAGQNSFYPSYSTFQNQPLGHSRPFYYNQQEGAYSQRTPYHANFDHSARFSGYKDNYNYNSQKNDQGSILGSGNFGVIPGGTFYGENDENSNYENYDSYYQNGHGKPQSYHTSQSNPQHYQQEQFANFRDFADINTPNDRQYSQFVIVYAPSTNDTKEDKTDQKMSTKPVPRNIIESLTLIDLEHPTSTTVPVKKLSKSKRKLALLPPEKKHLQKSLKKLNSKDLEEPLIALS